MTTPTKEDMSNLGDVITHLQGRVEKFEELKKIIRDIRDQDDTVYLDASPDSRQVTVRVEREHKPIGPMIELLDLQDSHEKIEYYPEEGTYSLTVKLFTDR